MLSDQEKIKNIFDNIRADSALVAILEYLNKVYIPIDRFEDLINKEQVWPNDYIYNHGASMAICYDEEKRLVSFELKYSDDEDHPKNLIGYQCTRNVSDVGFIDHNSPLYRK